MNQIINTADCEFDKARKVLLAKHDLIKGGFPKEVDVLSAHTGKTITFVYDYEAAEHAEGWDGEMAEYKPSVEGTNVKTLVIYNG